MNSISAKCNTGVSELDDNPVATPARPLRIVLVEDHADIRETLGQWLEIRGHTVYDIARAVRRQIPNGGIKLIAVTGNGQPSDRVEALQAGFDAHLLQPIAPQVLERALAA